MLHRFFIYSFLILIGCNSTDEKSDKNVAGVKHFYFEFIDDVQTDYSILLINKVSSIFPQYDYIMSEESAEKGWPFYGNVTRGSKVLKTEMMPPHSNVNRLSPIDKLTTYNNGEHTLKVRFTLTRKNDSTIAITKESFDWKEGEWHKFSKKLTTDFAIDQDNQKETISKISKTLIRYTFK